MPVPFLILNREAFERFLWLEIALRELTRMAYEKDFGVKWQGRLPGKLLSKIRTDQSDEERRSQFEFLALGPLYYLTFGELLEILAQKPAKELLADLCGSDFAGALQALVPVRNALAHSRDVSVAGHAALASTSLQLETALRTRGWEGIVDFPDVGVRPRVAVARLQQVLCECQPLLRSLKQLSDAHFQSHIDARRQYWWADPSLAGFDTKSIDETFRLLNDYRTLPSGIGAAAGRQRFIDENNLLEAISNGLTIVESVK